MILTIITCAFVAPSAIADTGQPLPPTFANMSVVSLDGNNVTVNVDFEDDSVRMKVKVVNMCPIPGEPLPSEQTQQLTGDGMVKFTNAAGACTAVAYWKGKLLWFAVGSVEYVA